ncbi:hypothetical protein GGI23_002148 [Coemansia sp. RSA 2559]|nr:hypothetical protein GGI23_002148 [Coemansia sp. RSA 2559]KAJ2863610.1 hypothetical protein GGI22_001913 [Coemansia erecta]
MVASTEFATTPYTRHFYPVLGVLNAPQSALHSKNTDSALQLTPYARQVGRSILKHFGSNANSPPEAEAATDSATQQALGIRSEDGEQNISGWDPAGPSRAPRWQTVAFDRVDDIPRRKAWRQGDTDEPDLSPRSTSSELWGEGLMTPRWIAKQQQRRPATIVSFHALHQGSPGGARGSSLGGSDTLLAEELARNRVCVAAFGLTYTAVVIINRALAEDDAKGTEARLLAIMQRSGLDQQLAVCRPGSAQQFQQFVDGLERKLFTRAAAYYADAFVRTQKKMVAVPQLPVPMAPDRPDAVYRSLYWSSEARMATARLVESDRSLIAKYARFLPLRAWLARYHFKLSVFAECAGDRDTAQRCLWMAYVHLLCYVAEIACGAYLPPSDNTDAAAIPRGWMWALNGGDHDGRRAHSMRMFGKRWAEAIELLDAIHVRLVRGWLYQSLGLAALRAKNHQSVFSASGASGSGSNSSGWAAAYGFGQQQRPQQPYVVAPINRSGAQGLGGSGSSSSAALGMLPPGPRSPGAAGAGASAASSGISISISSSSTGANAGSISGTNGCLEPFVFSVHAGEANAATEQLMLMERARRADPTAHPLTSSETDGLVYYVALGSETADADLLQPVVASAADKDAAAAAASGWWPLGGMYGVLDFGRPQPAPQRKRRDAPAGDAPAGWRPTLGVVANSSLDVACASLMLPQSNQYDQCLTMAGRQGAEHIVAVARVLAAGGFGDSSSYFWACIARQCSSHAALYQLAAARGLGFARALDSVAAQRTPAADAHGKQLLEALVQSLRAPSRVCSSSSAPKEAAAGARAAPSTAFVGFAFGQALRDRASMPAEAATAADVLRSPGGSAHSVASVLFPQWMWPESAAPLLQAAALASMRQRQAFVREEQVYLGDAADGLQSVCATPGVANTYAAAWLVPERKALAATAARSSGSDACVLLLESALLLHSSSSSSSSNVAGAADLNEDALVRLIREGSHMVLFLASELAELYMEDGKHARALVIFALLADRFRAEGWALLTGHALQWVLKYCYGSGAAQPSASDSSSSEVRAMLELLSPHVVASANERSRTAEAFLRRLAQTTELLGAGEPSQQADCNPIELKIDMTRIYSPMACHAHWRHWRPTAADAAHMAFQVAVDCRDLAVPLALSELAIRIGSTFDVRIADDATGAAVAARDITCVDGNQNVRYYDIGTIRPAAGSASGGLRLELQPHCITVFEGRLSLADDDLRMVQRGGSSPAGRTCSSVVLDSVSLYIASGGEWRLRLFWPTCADPAAGGNGTTPGRPMSLASTHASTVSQGQAKQHDEEDAAAALNPIERLLLSNIGIARMQDGGGKMLGPSSQLALPSAAAYEDVALQKAICTAGPAASAPKQLIRKWLHIAAPQNTHGRWVQLPAPPLDAPSAAADAARHEESPGSDAEPTVSVYSRCRALHLPAPEPALAIDVSAVAALAPAYAGEAFPVRIAVTNTHRLRKIARIEVSASVEAATHASSRASMSDLEVAGPDASLRTSLANAAVRPQLPGMPPPTLPPGALALGSESASTRRTNSPWLSSAIDPSQDPSRASNSSISRPQSICFGLDNTKELGPGDSHAATLYVHFPSPALSSAAPAGEAAAAAAAEEDEESVSLGFTARYVFSEQEEKNGGARWNGQATAQTAVPVVRPLAAHAEALALPASCAASSTDSWLLGQPIPASLPAAELSSSSGFSFRRPVLVTLVNRGPWAVAVEKMALQPPRIEGFALPMHVQVAAASACHAEGDSSVVAANGGTLKHVFWLDIHTRDVIRMPTSVSVGTLEIQWRRAAAAHGPLLQPQLARLWLPPLELVRKQVQVDMQTSSAVARVGRALTVCYRVLNPTRAVQTVQTAMHASDAFVFAGLRKTTLHVLPGHVALLRFNMVPTMASQQHQQQQRQADPLPVEYAPGHAVLALAARQKEKSRHANPQSNLAGLGWTLLPRLDVRIAGASDDGGTPQSVPNNPARGIFSPPIPPPSPFSAAAPPPPPPPPASRASLAAQEGLEAMTRRAQKTIVALAGLEIPEGDDWPMDLLSPELARSSLDMLPEYFVRALGAAGAESDVDSDAEDSPEDIARSTSIDIQADEDDGGDAVLRYDQTTIFCSP